ncbi:MAG: prephenate dehydrogenase [Chloroflexota bacterium]
MKVAIIGGSGRMGRWFADLLLKDGKEVVISGRNEPKLLEAGRQLGVEVGSNVEAIKRADAVLLSVPLESLEQVAAEIAPYITPGQVIVDITSTKARPVAIMHKYLGAARVLGAHCLFGPGAKGLAHQNFVLTPTDDAERALAQEVRAYLEARGARVTLMSPEEHDGMMTIILGLAHYIAIVSADTLLSGDKLKQMQAIGGITYKVLMTLVESVISEDPELYASLQMSLPGVAQAEEAFQQRAREWTELVKTGDRPEFVRRMKALKAKLEAQDSDLGRAYDNMYRIVEGL